VAQRAEQARGSDMTIHGRVNHGQRDEDAPSRFEPTLRAEPLENLGDDDREPGQVFFFL
jgi:hypothetical protein